MILNLYKKEGETPLQRIERYKLDNPLSKNDKMTYAGRLDPMAEGVLIVLTGSDVHKKDDFLHLDKVYEFEVLWGVSSDTYDILGETVFGGGVPTDIELIEDTQKFVGAIELPYPAYSSKTVWGKPLWTLARAGELSELEFPKRSMNIKGHEFNGTRTISSEDLSSQVKKRISTIVGDFRQEEILISWREGLKSNNKSQYAISKFTAEVSSGTYIRSLAVRIAEKYNTKALAWTIRRTKVGDYEISNSVD